MNAPRSAWCALTVLFGLATSCAANPAESSTSSGAVRSSASATPSATATPSASTAASASSGPVVSSSGATAAQTVPIFIYEEGGDRVEFLPPSTTRITRKSGQQCVNDLPENGNMYSGTDVTRAFDAAGGTGLFANHSTYSGDVAATLVAPGQPGSVTWVTSCRGCLEEPQAVKGLRTVLTVVMRNRRLLCP